MRELVEGVAVVGAGLAGLTLAAALRARRQPVEVLDASDTAPAGHPRAWLCLWSGALTAFERSGIPSLVGRGVPIDRVQVWSDRGNLLVDLPARDAPVGGLVIRYPALMDALVAGCEGVPFHAGQQLIGYAEDPRGVVITCHGGWDLRAPVLVGADGPRSMVRRQCRDDGLPSYSGDSAYEGITVGLRRLDPGIMKVFWGPYGVRAGAMAVDREGNWAWWVDEPAGVGLARDDHRAKPMLRDLLADMHGPMLDFVEATPDEEIARRDVMARRHPGAGGAGRATLIGDAWHPLPVSARLGDTLACEDAVELAEILTGESDPIEAFRAFERSRRARVTWACDTVWRLRSFETRFSRAAVRARDFTARHIPASVLQRLLGRLLADAPPAATRARPSAAGSPEARP
jgi:2-polyprenyl-6-methoxyphenol hydroxylase-like FAD-dependent oxidoreductase